MYVYTYLYQHLYVCIQVQLLVSSRTLNCFSHMERYSVARMFKILDWCALPVAYCIALHQLVLLLPVVVSVLCVVCGKIDSIVSQIREIHPVLQASATIIFGAYGILSRNSCCLSRNLFYRHLFLLCLIRLQSELCMQRKDKDPITLSCISNSRMGNF